jgi:hypothetical protein
MVKANAWGAAIFQVHWSLFGFRWILENPSSYLFRSGFKVFLAKPKNSFSKRESLVGRNPANFSIPHFVLASSRGGHGSSSGRFRKNGDPGETRTHNIQLRRLALYPIELRGLIEG